MGKVVFFVPVSQPYYLLSPWKVCCWVENQDCHLLEEDYLFNLAKNAKSASIT